jgi:glycosyltransferase involved in cell wall biosynthesis
MIVHMTSVHSPMDPRIFEKECRSLVEAGHQVTLIAPGDADKTVDGVRIVAVPKARHRLGRMLCTTARVWRVALSLRADAYHFHDPELIPWALALRAAGRKVIYDVHEDYVSAIEQKEYLGPFLGHLLARVWDVFERLVSRAFHVVLAERYYFERLPRGRMVLNYPAPRQELVAARGAFSPASRRLLYTGNVTEDRGALIHAAIVSECPEYEVHLIGRCTRGLAAKIEAGAQPNAARLTLVGVDEYVPFSRIARAYTEEQWLCGLALFPLTPHYLRKELTKFFEYMQAGLPIICSDFPAWRQLIEGNGVGLCVPPNDAKRVLAAVDWLRDHPQEAAQMGERGRALVKERFSWQSQANELCQLYEEILRAE